MSKEIVKKKRISGEAYDINKDTVYIVLKSKIESRVHYAPETGLVWYRRTSATHCTVLVRRPNQRLN